MAVHWGGRGVGHNSRWPKSPGPPAPSINLSASSVSEDAATNTVIGALSVANHSSGSSGWTFAITSQTPSGKLNISTANLRTNAALDYETNPTLSVTITASKSGQTDIVQVFTITVTNVLEAANLAALGFSGTLTQGASSTVNITSATSGSTLTASGLPAGMSINSGARTITGTPTTLGTGSATITETLADSANSPRDTVWNWEVVEASEEPTAEIWLLGPSDSRGPGRADRDGTDWSVMPDDIWAWRWRSSTITHTLPLDQGEEVPGYLTSPLSFLEQFAEERFADTSLPIFLIPYGIGGSAITNDGGWEVGNSAHEAAITNANTAIQAILAQEPGARVAGRFVIIGTNDAGGGATSTFYDNLSAQQADFCARVFQNGVSGEDIYQSLAVLIGLQPETRRTLGPPPNTVERGICKVSGTVPNGVYVKLPDGLNNGDNLHEDHDGINTVGTLAAAAVLDTAAPVIDFPSSFSIYTGQKLSREVSADKDCYFTVSGADAALFEIVGEDPTPAGGAGSDLFTYRLRFVGDGDAPTPGTYNFNIDAIRHGVTTSEPVVMTAVAAYGSQVEAITTEWTIADGFATTGEGRRTLANVPFKRGLNIFSILQVTTTVDSYDVVRASNGLIGVPDVDNTTGAAAFYFYSAQDETVDVIVEFTGGTPGIWGFNVALTGTEALPTDTETTTSTTTGSMTCPTDGIIVNAGFATGGTTPATGCTALPNPPIAGDSAMYANYRTTTGAIGAQGGFARLLASAWAKAT